MKRYHRHSLSPFFSNWKHKSVKPYMTECRRKNNLRREQEWWNSLPWYIKLWKRIWWMYTPPNERS